MYIIDTSASLQTANYTLLYNFITDNWYIDTLDAPFASQVLSITPLDVSSSIGADIAYLFETWHSGTVSHTTTQKSLSVKRVGKYVQIYLPIYIEDDDFNDDKGLEYTLMVRMGDYEVAALDFFEYSGYIKRSLGQSVAGEFGISCTGISMTNGIRDDSYLSSTGFYNGEDIDRDVFLSHDLFDSHYLNLTLTLEVSAYPELLSMLTSAEISVMLNKSDSLTSLGCPSICTCTSGSFAGVWQGTSANLYKSVISDTDVISTVFNDAEADCLSTVKIAQLGNRYFPFCIQQVTENTDGKMEDYDRIGGSSFIVSDRTFMEVLQENSMLPHSYTSTNWITTSSGSVKNEGTDAIFIVYRKSEYLSDECALTVTIKYNVDFLKYEDTYIDVSFKDLKQQALYTTLSEVIGEGASRDLKVSYLDNDRLGVVVITGEPRRALFTLKYESANALCVIYNTDISSLLSDSPTLEDFLAHTCILCIPDYALDEVVTHAGGVDRYVTDFIGSNVIPLLGDNEYLVLSPFSLSFSGDTYRAAYCNIPLVTIPSSYHHSTYIRNSDGGDSLSVYTVSLDDKGVWYNSITSTTISSAVENPAVPSENYNTLVSNIPLGGFTFSASTLQVPVDDLSQIAVSARDVNTYVVSVDIKRVYEALCLGGNIYGAAGQDSVTGKLRGFYEEILPFITYNAYPTDNSISFTAIDDGAYIKITASSPIQYVTCEMSWLE